YTYRMSYDICRCFSTSISLLLYEIKNTSALFKFIYVKNISFIVESVTSNSKSRISLSISSKRIMNNRAMNHSIFNTRPNSSKPLKEFNLISVICLRVFKEQFLVKMLKQGLNTLPLGQVRYTHGNSFVSYLKG